MRKIEFIGKSLLIDNSVLVFGDLHLGYEGSLHKSGIFVKADLYKHTTENLDEIFDRIKEINIGKFDFGVVKSKRGRKTGEIKEREERGENGKLIDKVIILGDLKHEFGSILREEWKEILDLIDYLKEKCREIVIVRGNHDIFTESILKKKDLKIIDFCVWKEFAFLHGDRDFPKSEIYDKKIKYWIMGHGHPAIVLEEKGGIKKEKYKCFLIGKLKGKHVIIVPSFFNLQEGSDPRDFDMGLIWDFDLDKFKVKIVGDNLGVLDFGELGEL